MKQLKTFFNSSCSIEQDELVIFSFFGPPGSGKGTLAQALVQRENFRMLSTGNLCRWHVAQKTAFGHLVDEYLKRGHLIPDVLITDIVIDWLKQHMLPNSGPIVLDGFPRTEGQAKLFLEYLHSVTDLAINFRVILFQVSNSVIIDRLVNRVVCVNKSCQVSLSTKNISEVVKTCNICGNELIQRDDDRKEIVQERLLHYPTYRDVLLAFYACVNQSVENFDLMELSCDEVFNKFIGLYGKTSI